MLTRKLALGVSGCALLGYCLYRASVREANKSIAEDTPELISDLEIMRWMGSLHFENDKDFVGALNEYIPNLEGPL